MADTTTQEPPPAEATEAPTLSPPPQPAPVKAPMTVTNGLRLATIPEMEEFARYAIASGYAPDGITTASQGVIALQIGAELGMMPMLSLQSIAIVHKRPTLWGDAMLGLCQRSPCFDHTVFKEWFTGTPMQDDWTAHTQCRRTNGVLTERTFSVADATRAGLWGNTKKPTWNTHPQRMLQYKARAFALRDTFADVLRGLHAAEEMIDVDQVLSQIDLAGTTRTDQLKQYIKANRPGAAPTNSPPTKAQPAADVPGTDSAAAAVPEPPVPEEAKVSRDAYLVRLSEVVDCLSGDEAKTLRSRYGLVSLTKATALKQLNDANLAALTIAAETRVRGATKDE